MIDTLFTDQVYGDLEQIERINQLVHEAPFAARGLKHVDTLMLAPSVDPREIAGRYTDDMPREPAGAAAGDRRPGRRRDTSWRAI